MNKILVYTAVTGGYDSIKEIDNIENNIDYYCITDEHFKGEVPYPWKHIILRNSKKDAKNLARYCKMVPHRLFPNYDVSIWIDGNISIKGEISMLLNDALKKGNIASYDHWGRNNIYQEFQECALIGHDFAWILDKQLKYYKDAGFESNSLFETNVLIRRHNDHNVKKTMELWLEHYDTFGKRDQYSFTFVCFKNNEHIVSLGRHDPRYIKKYFDYHGHLSTKRTIKLRMKRLLNLIYLRFNNKNFN
ncbi:glycosyltransferase domain-containing protein [Photobacterium damselae]|uniref:glycosyltransferase domain-containing protein n=1 Tax=Photobacterium damselae TaxID=38293 RepID=UPI00370BACDE